MKKLVAMIVAATLLVGGCSLFSRGGKPEAPQVTVKNGQITVDPEPLRFKVGGAPVDIVWKVEGNLRFAQNGIVIDGEVEKVGAPPNPRQDQIVECRLLGDSGQQFTCKNQRSRKGIFKYTVRLVQDGKPLPPHDPGIMNLE